MIAAMAPGLVLTGWRSQAGRGGTWRKAVAKRDSACGACAINLWSGFGFASPDRQLPPWSSAAAYARGLIPASLPGCRAPEQALCRPEAQ